MSELFERTANTAKLKISYAEFIEIYQGTHAEWVDGEVNLFMPAGIRHQDAANFLVNLLKTLSNCTI
jgi:hypothetical protein